MQAARSRCKTRTEEGGEWKGRLIVREHTRAATPGDVPSRPQWAQHPHSMGVLLCALPVLVEGAVRVKLQSRQGAKAGEAPPDAHTSSGREKGCHLWSPSVVRGLESWSHPVGCSWPISRMKTLSPREVQQLSGGHIARMAEPR